MLAQPDAELFTYRLLQRGDPLDDIVLLAQEAHAESRFGHIPFSARKARAIAEKALDDPSRHGVMLARRAGRPVGFVYCSVGEYHIGEGVLLTTIHNLNVASDVRRRLSGGKIAISLLKGVETWSEARGAREVLFHVTSGVDLARAHKFTKRVGFTFIGGSYAK